MGKILKVIFLCIAVLLLFSAVAAVAIDKVMTRNILRDKAAEIEGSIRYATINDARIAYRKLGNGDETLLLIHGFMGSSYDFNKIMPRLAEAYTVYAIDQIGFGLSDKSLELDYSKANSAVLAGALMQELGVEKYHLLGHSMGGEVAMRLTLDSPDRINKLILLDSAGADDLQNGRNSRLPGWLVDHVLQNYVLQRLVFLRTVQDWKIAGAENFAGFFYLNKQIPAATLNKIIMDNDSGEIAGKIGEIRQPALIVWGRQDKIIPLDQGRAIDQALPDSKMVILEDCGHLPYLEKPAELTAAILDFLAEP